MANPKKDRGGPKKERKGSAPVDSDSDPSSKEEQEEVVPASVLKKQQRQRAAFFSLARQLITFLVAALVFSQQPFLVRPRGAGENALKLVPLKLAACGAGNWAAESPFMMRQPKLYEMLNATGAGLMAPFEWYRARTSVRAVDSEKTLSAALRKGGKAYARAVDADRSLRQIALQPSPNARDLLRPPAFGVASRLSRVASVRPRCRCSARTLASSARSSLPSSAAQSTWLPSAAARWCRGRAAAGWSRSQSCT